MSEIFRAIFTYADCEEFEVEEKMALQLFNHAIFLEEFASWRKVVGRSFQGRYRYPHGQTKLLHLHRQADVR